MNVWRDNAIAAGIGLSFGFVLSRLGASSWDEGHAMFTFGDLRLTLAMATAMAILAAAWIVIARVTAARWRPRGIHPGTFAGGAIFGAGWALGGGCPSIALVQLGELQMGALATLAGVFLGNWGYAVVHARYFRWSQAGCDDR